VAPTSHPRDTHRPHRTGHKSSRSSKTAGQRPADLARPKGLEPQPSDPWRPDGGPSLTIYSARRRLSISGCTNPTAASWPSWPVYAAPDAAPSTNSMTDPAEEVSLDVVEIGSSRSRREWRAGWAALR